METVYAPFGTKAAILKRGVGEAVVGDDRPVPLLEREGPQRVRREPDQRRQIQLFAKDIRQTMGRASGLHALMRVAAETDADVEARRQAEQRTRGMTFFLEALTAHGPLRAGLSTELAAETVWALTSAEVYRLLTVERGWSEDRYEAWLADNLTALLLPPAG